MKNFLLQRKTTVLPVPDITLRDGKYARIAQFWAQSLDQQSVDKRSITKFFTCLLMVGEVSIDYTNMLLCHHF